MQSTIAQSSPDILTGLIYDLLKADLKTGLTFLVDENYFDLKLAFNLLLGNELKRLLLIGQAVDELIARDETKANALIQLLTSCRRQFTDIRDRVVEAYDERVCERCKPSATKMAVTDERDSELSKGMLRVKDVMVEDMAFPCSCDEQPSVQELMSTSGTLIPMLPESSSYGEGDSESRTCNGSCLRSMKSGPKVVPATELKRSDRIYKMTAKPRGFCVIINNVDFEKHARRDGSDVEAEFLESIFDQLYFEVKVHRNLKRDQMLNTLEAVAKDPKLVKHDAFVCIILSHGDQGGPMGVDAETLPLDKMKVDGIGCPLKAVTEIFSNQHCPNLKNKPKMFFIQACRGVEIDEGVTYDGNTFSHGNRSTQNESQKRIPKITDMYVCWPSRDGQLALRNPKTGSWFGNTIGEVIRDHAWEYHLGDIMEEVTDRIKCRIGRDGCLQSTCVYQIGWSKKLYFNPKLHLSNGMNQLVARVCPGYFDRGSLKSYRTLSSEKVIRDSNGVDINSKISRNDKSQDVHQTRSTFGLDVSEKANCLDKKVTNELQHDDIKLNTERLHVGKAVDKVDREDQANVNEVIRVLLSKPKIESVAEPETIGQACAKNFSRSSCNLRSKYKPVPEYMSDLMFDLLKIDQTDGLAYLVQGNYMDHEWADQFELQENELMKLCLIQKAVDQLLQKDEAKANELIYELVRRKNRENVAAREKIDEGFLGEFCKIRNIGGTEMAADSFQKNTNLLFNKIEFDARGHEFLDIKLSHSIVSEEQHNVQETMSTSGKSYSLPSTMSSPESMKTENLVKPATFLRSSESFYEMISKLRGYCIILNNVNYWHASSRYGSDREATFLKSIFEQLFFDVKLVYNQTGHQMLTHLKEVAQDPTLSHHDALVCIILSHGSEHGIIGVDGETIPLETLIEPFNNKNCPRLINKPKMFFVTACRGGKLDNGVTIDGGLKDDITTDGYNTMKIHTLTDTYICCASSKGSVANRDVETGSWFGNALGEVIRDHAWEHHLDDMMKMVYSYFCSKIHIVC